jgi:hypothetical protein
MTLYLNNDGSRWIEFDGRKRDMKFVLVLPDGSRKVRQADYYFAFGNFAGIAYRYRGQRFNGLPKACDGSETRLGTETGQDALQHVFHKV